jgi:hypothetical protein
MFEAVEHALGPNALDTIKPVDSPPEDIVDTTLKLVSIPACRTQKPMPRALKGSPAAIYVGLDAECPRWKPGSVIRWAAWRAGFENEEDADYAALQLEIAAQKWNAAEVGVTFEWVQLAKDATFVLCHGGKQPGGLAEAFFPTSADLSTINVYELAFTKEWKGHMWNVFVHELGHVLGLRHEFAMDYYHPYYEGGDKRAELIGPRDPLSVMNYRKEPPEIQQSDIDSTRAFYALGPDAKGNPPYVGGTAIVDYKPM